MQRLAPLFFAASLSGCTTLGPVAAMTGLPAIPQEHADVEAQAGFVPGFHLSDTVQRDEHGARIRQASVMFEPNDLFEQKELQGLSAGARYVGDDRDAYFEPMLRYRRWFDDEQRLAFAVTGFGTHTSDSSHGASYTLTHLGGETAFDLRATPPSHWLELHLTAGGSFAGMFARGRYCADPIVATDPDSGYAKECGAATANASASLNQLLPTFFVGASLDSARHLGNFVHGVRLSGWMGGGLMPVVRGGVLEERRGFAALGAALSVGFGGS